MLRAHKQLVRGRISAQLRTIPSAEIERQSIASDIGLELILVGRVVTTKLFAMDVWKK